MPRGKFSVTGETTLVAKLAGDFKDCEWIYRFGANPGMPRGGVLPPTPVLAPEPALGSRPRVALSSAQTGAMYYRPGPAGKPRLDQVLNDGRNNSTGTASPERDRLPGPSPRGEFAREVRSAMQAMKMCNDTNTLTSRRIVRDWIAVI